ncbi:hypothetical protein GCM10010109_21210 [Actinoplanes campanulatus]|nr:hypothetical protein GCM10010109_21210 [Actinoplanes campanulatus]GID36637.1 hypothetical protein Aca09nite_31430 [Actinoplanes campanulatus]
MLGRGPSGPTDHWLYVPSEYLGCGWYGMAWVTLENAQFGLSGSPPKS